MKKRIIISVLLILFVAISSVNFVSAYWGAFECEGFSIEMPEGVEVATGYSPSSPPDHVKLVTDSGSYKWDFLSTDLSEVPLENLPNHIIIAENHTEDNLTIVKGQVDEGAYPPYLDGTNITYAEFDKDGKHFYVAIDHTYRSLDEIKLNDDIELVKKINESIQVK